MIIAVDFDGTLCVDTYPNIGLPKESTIRWVKKQKELGHYIVLWTCREGTSLYEAVVWCEKQGLFFNEVNRNIPELRFCNVGHNKIVADIYLDDKALKLEDIHFLENAKDFIKG